MELLFDSYSMKTTSYITPFSFFGPKVGSWPSAALEQQHISFARVLIRLHCALYISGLIGVLSFCYPVITGVFSSKEELLITSLSLHWMAEGKTLLSS